VRLWLGVAAGLLVLLQDAEPEASPEDPHAAWRARLARDSRSVELADVSGLTCAACHADVTAEWRLSTHATSWQDERYQKELRRTRKKDRCTGCHAPEPMVPAGLATPPATRDEHRHLGVECASCHLDVDGETILGPYGVETDAHGTARSDLFTEDNNALCISCHATTIGPVIGIAQDFVDTKQSELGLSCIGCHMPGLRGPIANDDEGTEYPIRSRRSHRLNTPRDPLFLASAFGLRAEHRDGHAVLVIENRTGHRVPGTTRRDLTFRIQVIDAHDDVVAEHEHLIDHRRYLPVDEDVEVELAESGTTLRVRGLHETEGMRRAQEFLDVVIEVE